MPAESPESDRTNAREAEARWQKIWDQRGIFKAPNPPSRSAGALADERPGCGPQFDRF